MREDIIDKSILIDAYKQEDESLRIRRSIIGCILILILMPAGSIADFFVYREHLGYFFKARLLVALIVAMLLAVHFTALGRHHIKTLGLTLTLLLNLSFCWMIYITEGSVSPYYAAINLILLSVTALLPLTLLETLFISIVTLVIYFIACYMHSGVEELMQNRSIFFNNVYFITLTGILCTTSNYFSANARFQDFLLRHELDITNKKLKNLDRLKSQFFANVSHELRTPLTLILAPIDTILSKHSELPDPVYKAILLMRRNGLRLLKLINELLDVMRLEENKIMLNKETINLSLFVPGIIDSVRHLGISKQLRMKTERPSGDLLALSNADRLEKVVLNLLSNAIKFTPKEGQIVIRIFRKNDHAMIRVFDTGIGIDKKDLSLIFDRFHQVDGSATRAYQGVGIGLSLSRDLIEKQGGTLTVESEKGEGSVFSITLPLSPENDPALAISAPVDLAENEPFATAFKSADRLFVVDTHVQQKDLPVIGTGEYTVLVVDDEPDMLDFLVSILSDNYRVLRAVDGSTAIALAQKEHPSLVLLDWMIPEKSGLEVCRTLRNDESTQDIKLIILTARIDEESKIRILREGADDFLTKPFSTIEVKTRIANLIRTASLQNDLKSRNAELTTMFATLQNTESQLVQSEKMNALGILSAGLLHEINNPLNFTLAAIEFGRQSITNADNDILEVLEDIEDGMKRISCIVSDLRTFAYPEKVGNVTAFRIDDVLTSAMRLVSHELAAVHVERLLDPAIEISGSQMQVTHVFINLLINAGKALSGRKDQKITISGELIDDRYHVRILDTGRGIREEIIAKIFEPFFTTSDVGKGIGLGLSMCHTIITNHDGQIQVKSLENEWTEISFDLPIAVQIPEV